MDSIQLFCAWRFNTGKTEQYTKKRDIIWKTKKWYFVGVFIFKLPACLMHWSDVGGLDEFSFLMPPAPEASSTVCKIKAIEWRTYVQKI